MTTPQPFSDDSARVSHVVVVAVFSFIAILALILRLWARKIQRTTLDLSDYLLVVGLIWTLAESIFLMYSNIYWDLGGDLTQYGNPNAIMQMVVLQLKAMLVGIILWAVSVFLIRASVLVLYIRIFRTRSFRITCYVVHGINLAFFVSTILSSALICRPLSYSWDKSIPDGKCGDPKSLDLFISIVNLLLDVCVVVLPMPVLWGLQMAFSKKLMLSGMFGMGIVICGVTLTRIRITFQYSGNNSQKIYSLISLLACMEAILGIINACLPVLKPVFRKVVASKPSNWLSSVMSGSIPIFMRRSQVGTNYTTTNSTKRQSGRGKRDSGQRNTMPFGKWPGSPNSKTPPNTVIALSSSSPSPPRYADSKAARMMFSPTYTTTTSTSPGHQGPDSSRPPVPPKDVFDRHRGRWEPPVEENGGGNESKGGIWVHKEWNADVERGDSAETERELLRKEEDEGEGRGF